MLYSHTDQTHVLNQIFIGNLDVLMKPPYEVPVIFLDPIFAICWLQHQE